MTTTIDEPVAVHDHVPPRPVSKLPELAPIAARRKAADKLIETFSLDEAAASTIADAVVDPAELRRSIETPTQLAITGGTLLAVRAEVWARRTLPDIRNPRIGAARRHPIAVEPGTDEESRFAPVGDPTSEGTTPHLTVEVESAEHMRWASGLAARAVLEANDWRYSIRNQGVLTEVWLVATRYDHTEDGSPALWAMTTAEGSSRTTAAHDVLGMGNSVDAVVTASSDTYMRGRIKELNTALEQGPTIKQSEALRCETLPALILVGYQPLSGGPDRFSSAVKSLVALRHVDAPKAWGDGPEMESLADEALAVMEDRGILTPLRRRWFAGSISRAQANAAHLPTDQAIRAAEIIALFTSDDQLVRDAIRDAVTRQSTRKRITKNVRVNLAVALIVRAVAGEGANPDRVRRYMQHGFVAVRDRYFKPTHRDADVILTDALDELDQDPAGEPGPARLDLAARSAYPLIATLSLWADRGTQNNPNADDRRRPGEVIDTMLTSRLGIRQLHRAIVDHHNGRSTLRAVNEDGSIRRTEDRAQDQILNDVYLRSTFPKPGSPQRPTSTDTPDDALRDAAARLGAAVRAVEDAMAAIRAVKALDGTDHVETVGADRNHVKEWKNVLDDATSDLEFWGRIWERRNRGARATARRDDNWETEYDDDTDRAIDTWEDEDADNLEAAK
ncbi:hypothetical protein E0H26_22350 [Micromonospora zingiberis]|uniref:Uncharacterized protein n=1 Tax=Micromonospora zingiberis TaxID=2053011 RepID=A0A4R0G9V1_9ACTN|nr:hypothetical protein [Micromonospora zingiberis]TCB93506.1 hypothetical protein E0H26_22350 [Micromonospora zingiberis]